MSNPISDFYNVIWSFRRGEETIEAFINGEYTLESYAELLYDKRKAFDNYVMDLCLNGGNFKSLRAVIYRLGEQIHYYNEDETVYPNGTPQYYRAERDKIRYSEILLAVKHTESFMRENGFEFSFGCSDGVKKVEPKIVPHYFNGLDNYTKEQLADIYNGLKEKGYLSINTTEDEFMYYFSGEGNKPSRKLKWIGKKGKLALFIWHFFDCNNKWIITEEVFEEQCRTKLKNSLNTEFQNGRKKYFKEFENKYLKHIKTEED